MSNAYFGREYYEVLTETQGTILEILARKVEREAANEVIKYLRGESENPLLEDLHEAKRKILEVIKRERLTEEERVAGWPSDWDFYVKRNENEDDKMHIKGTVRDILRRILTPDKLYLLWYDSRDWQLYINEKACLMNQNEELYSDCVKLPDEDYCLEGATSRIFSRVHARAAIENKRNEMRARREFRERARRRAEEMKRRERDEIGNEL